MEATLSPEPSLPYFRAESQSPSVLWVALTRCGVQIGTTKGTGGDVLILEEAAYCDEGFFYETVAPILSIGSASLVAISTLTSEINFYTRLIQMIDPATERPLFAIRHGNRRQTARVKLPRIIVFYYFSSAGVVKSRDACSSASFAASP